MARTFSGGSYLSIVLPTESGSGTTIPPSSNFLDALLNVWTLSGGQAMVNGSPAGYSSGVTEMAYVNHTVWQFNGTYWYSWSGSQWSAGTTQSPLGGGTESASGTIIPPTANITDAQLNVWTLVNGVVQENGLPAGYSSGVTEIAYVNHVVWQFASPYWYSWNGSAWGGQTTTSPLGGGSGGTTFQYYGLVTDNPTGNPIANAYVNNPCNSISQPSADALYMLVTGTSANVGATQADFKWSSLDNVMAFCRLHNTKFIWYCGYLNWAEQSPQNFPANFGWTGGQVIQLFNNVIKLAYQRYPDITNYCLFNYCNEGFLHGNTSGNWASSFGGGATTWIINTGNVIRSLIPGATIGCNDYNYEDSAPLTGSSLTPITSLLTTALARIPSLVAAGVLDWVGMEAYGMETQTSAGLTGALNNVGSLGTKVIYTEFTPGSCWHFWNNGNITDPPQNDNATWSDGGTSQGGSHQSNQTAAWKRLLPLLSGNQYCLGLTGPWAGGGGDFSGGYIFDGSPPVDRPAMTWIKSYIESTLGLP